MEEADRLMDAICKLFAVARLVVETRPNLALQLRMIGNELARGNAPVETATEEYDFMD